MESGYDRRASPYAPSAREIRRMCEFIRAGWTERERRKRAGDAESMHWTPPRVTVDEELLAADDEMGW